THVTPLVDAAEPPPAVVRQITRPEWISRPTGDDMARAYPEAAQRVNAGGSAILDCGVTAAGELTGCSVIDKNPPFLNIGQGVLRLQRFFKMQPTDAEGAPVAGGRVRIPVRYTLPGGTPWNERFAAVSACYGQTAQAAETNPAYIEAWNATVFWGVKLSGMVGSARGRPSDAENLMRAARLAAADGSLVKPQGADFAACMAAKD
ncbi:MAG TPA: TonB family protein, partial [Phenylobacterium sp.]|nr:TonB family protein [Phenylobacterium sp.]